MSRPALHPITTPRTWSLLVAPARIEIVEAMRIAAPCSIAEIAEILDRPADTLYRHVDKLVRAGIVVQDGVRRRGRRFEQVFDLVADDFRFAFRDGSGRAANKAFEECANSFLKSTMRAVRDSARAGQLVAGDDERNLGIVYELGRLTPEGFREVRTLITRIKSLMDEGKRSPEGRLYLSLSVLTPVTRKRGASRRAAPSAGRAEPAPKASRRTAGKAVNGPAKPVSKSASESAAKLVSKLVSKPVSKSAAKSDAKGPANASAKIAVNTSSTASPRWEGKPSTGRAKGAAARPARRSGAR